LAPADPAKEASVSKYRTYIAVLESKYSDASLINFADSTSAFALINFPMANLASVAADPRAYYRSWVSWISFIYMLSITTPLGVNWWIYTNL